MKQVFWAWLLCPVLLLGQGYVDPSGDKMSDPSPGSNADIFVNQSGVLIEKQFWYLGSVKGIEINVLKIYDLNTKKLMNCVRMQVDIQNTYGSGKTERIRTLDPDEVDGLIGLIKKLESDIFPTQREHYTEVLFRCRSGFIAGAYYENNLWKPFLYFDTVGKSSLFLTHAELSNFLYFLEEAKKKM